MKEIRTMVNIGNSWDTLLYPYFNSEEYKTLRKFLIEEYNNYKIYPNMYDIFNALKFTSFDDTKVVIIGQDPYHEEGQAHGLSFSVKKGVPLPPSLKNIFTELEKDLGIKQCKNGDLTYWAKQGVLLLNSVLTVRKGQANSHKNKGWERLLDEVVKSLNTKKEPVVFLLWGKNAREKKQLITNKNHLILESVHPSPLSAYAGFFGCKHFSKTNNFLKLHGIKEIDWDLNNF